MFLAVSSDAIEIYSTYVALNALKPVEVSDDVRHRIEGVCACACACVCMSHEGICAHSCSSCGMNVKVSVFSLSWAVARGQKGAEVVL